MKHLILLLFLLPSVSYSNQWFENEALAKPNPAQGSINGFGAMILMTTDSQQALENWTKSTPGVYIPDSDYVIKGIPIEALIVFAGCSANTEGNCVAEVDYRVTKPDGSILSEFKNTELWRNRPALPEGKLGLAVDRVGLVASPEDPLGIYTVHCTVRDVVADIEFKILATYEVLDVNN